MGDISDVEVSSDDLLDEEEQEIEKEFNMAKELLGDQIINKV